MKKYTSLLLAAFIHTALFQIASAQDGKTAMVPLPSINDFTRGNDGWSFGLGLGIEYESAYEGSDEFGFEASPAGAVQWRRGNNIFYWAGEALEISRGQSPHYSHFRTSYQNIATDF